MCNRGKMKIKEFFRKPLVKNILMLLAVPIFGYILLNITFIVDYLFQSAVNRLIGNFVAQGMFRSYPLFSPMMHLTFVLLIGLFSWLVFRSKLAVIFKAIFLTVPLVTVLVTLGIFLYRWPAISYSAGTIFSLAILYYLFKTKKHWLYFYTVILFSLIIFIFTLSGGEI